MSSAAATSLIRTPGKLLSFTAVALKRSPYLAIFGTPAFATDTSGLLAQGVN